MTAKSPYTPFLCMKKSLEAATDIDKMLDIKDRTRKVATIKTRPVLNNFKIYAKLSVVLFIGFIIYVKIGDFSKMIKLNKIC